MTRYFFKLIFFPLCCLLFTNVNAEDPLGENCIAKVGIEWNDGTPAYWNKDHWKIAAFRHGYKGCCFQAESCQFRLILVEEGPILQSIRSDIDDVNYTLLSIIQRQEDRIKKLEAVIGLVDENSQD